MNDQVKYVQPEAAKGDTAIQIVIEFDKGLLQHFDVAGWNRFVARLAAQNLIPPTWETGERPQPLVVLFDFSRLHRPRHRLDHIDLRLCWLEDADFTGASLRHAHLGCGRNVFYRQSRLDDASFVDIEISGCDFTDATGLETACWDCAVYDPANPPIGLPPEILAICLPEAEPPPTEPRTLSNPQEPTGLEHGPLQCHATIHVVPIGK